jgi:hypothetical protein
LINKCKAAASMVMKKSSNLGIVLGLIDKLLSD